MAQLAMSCDDSVVDRASEMLRAQYETVPRVLDMFGGGGTIPFEAKHLGLDSYSIDSNQLSVFIQKCNMLYADKIDLKQAEKAVQSFRKEGYKCIPFDMEPVKKNEKYIVKTLFAPLQAL